MKRKKYTARTELKTFCFFCRKLHYYQLSARFTSSYFLTFFFFFFILSPFLNCTFEFYAQVLLKLILSSRISRLHITRRFSSFALWAVSLHLRYSGLRMGWISVTTTLTRFVKQDLKTLVNTHAVPKTAKGAKTQLSGSKWREVRFSFAYREIWSRKSV